MGLTYPFEWNANKQLKYQVRHNVLIAAGDQNAQVIGNGKRTHSRSTLCKGAVAKSDLPSVHERVGDEAPGLVAARRTEDERTVRCNTADPRHGRVVLRELNRVPVCRSLLLIGVQRSKQRTKK